MIPRIIILSGISGAGKSTMARRLIEDYGISNAISVDLIRPMFDPRSDAAPMIYPLRVMDAWKILGHEKSSSSVLAALKLESFSICKHLRPMLAFCKARGHHVIIDGFHIYPSVFDEVCGKEDFFRVAICGFKQDTLIERQISRARDTHLNSAIGRPESEIRIFLELDKNLREDAMRGGWEIVDANLKVDEMHDRVKKHIDSVK